MARFCYLLLAITLGLGLGSTYGSASDDTSNNKMNPVQLMLELGELLVKSKGLSQKQLTETEFKQFTMQLWNQMVPPLGIVEEAPMEVKDHHVAEALRIVDEMRRLDKERKQGL